MKNPITSKGIFPCLIVFALFSLPVKTWAQSGKIAQKVISFKQAGSFGTETTLFAVAANTSKSILNEVAKSVKQSTILDIDPSLTVLKQKPAFLNFTVPVDNGRRLIRLLLYKESISPNGFSLLTSDGKTNTAMDIVHYKGSIDADARSVVSFSFSQNETMGLISNDNGNYVVGKLNNNSGKYIIYNDKDMVSPQVVNCGTNTAIPMSAGNYYRGT